MKVLVDTHAFFWWVIGDERLSGNAARLLEERSNQVVVSSVVAWELSTKSRLGKWPDGALVADRIETYIATRSLVPLSISIAHAKLGGRMPGNHRDPFDRILAAQARLEQIPLLTRDQAFSEFDIETLW